MLKMIVPICMIEQVPADCSEFQRKLRAMGMSDAADRLTYEDEFPKDDAACMSSINSSMKLEISH